MAISLEEKRSFPRVKVNCNTYVSRNRVALIDLSEGGLSFDAPELITRPSVSLQVQFPDRKFTLQTRAEVIWEKNAQENIYTYGVKFINLKGKDHSALRQELIKVKIEGLLIDVKSEAVKEHISYFFLNSVNDYISKVIVFASRIQEESPHSLEMQKEIEHLNTEILLRGYGLSLLLSDNDVMRRVKELFRSLVGAWAYKGIVLKKAFENKEGYCGDFMALEAVYNNKPLSKGLGGYYDRDFLRSPYAVALRSRNNKIGEMLREYINRNDRKLTINILNLACGSCREIMALAGTLESKSSLSFICIDGDSEALRFARSLFKKLPADISAYCLKKNVTEMEKVEKGLKGLGWQDLIYSAGLMDYLPDKILKEWLQFFSRDLSKGGQFIVTHQNREKNLPPLFPEWFCGWNFVSRSKDEFIALLRAALPGFSLDVAGDEFSYIYYFTLTKI